MRLTLRCAGLLLLVTAFVYPVAGADEKKTDEPKKIDEPKKVEDVKAKEGWSVVATWSGKVTAVQTAQKALTVQVKMPTPNQAAINRIAQLKAQLVGNRDANSIRSIQVQIAQQQANSVTYQDKDVQLVAHEDVKVRVSEPPTELNDKGDKKRYTKEELAKLKGPGNHWGYPAEFDQVSVGANVQAIVSKKKVDPKTKKKDDPPNEPVVTELRILYSDMKKDGK